MGIGFVINFPAFAHCHRVGRERLGMKEENEFQQHYHDASEPEQSGARLWNRYCGGNTCARLYHHAGILRMCARAPDQQRQPKRQLRWPGGLPFRRR